MDHVEEQLVVPRGADCIGVGPVFATKTKKDAAPPMGIEGLREVIRQSTVPVIAIGGITRANIPEVVAAGAAGVAIIGELMDAEDPCATAKALKALLVLSAKGSQGSRL